MQLLKMYSEWIKTTDYMTLSIFHIHIILDYMLQVKRQIWGVT